MRIKSGFKKQLKYPPPIECPQCGKKRDVFATLEGWLCWGCLPGEYLVDSDGIKYPEPVLTKKDRRDINEIRARLEGNTTPKPLGRRPKAVGIEHGIIQKSPLGQTKN